MRIGIAIGIAVLWLFCFIAVWQLMDISQAIAAVAIGFIINAIAALFAVMVGLSRLEDFLIRSGNFREFGPVADFWTVPAPTKPWFIIFGGKQPIDFGDPEMRVSFSTVFSYSQISGIIRQLYGPHVQITLKAFRDVDDWAAVSSSNVVFLGGILSIPRMKEVMSPLPLHAKQEVLRDGTRQIVTTDGYAQTVLQSKVEDAYVVEDHALVTRTISLQSRSAFFTISGGFGAGTGAAALTLTSRSYFNSIGFSKDNNFHEVIISAKNITGGQIYRGEPTVDCRPWRSRNIERGILVDLVRNICELDEGVQVSAVG